MAAKRAAQSRRKRSKTTRSASITASAESGRNARRLLGVAVSAILLGVVSILFVSWWTDAPPSTTAHAYVTAAAQPPGAPPLDAAQFLQLRAVDTVSTEQLKEEALQVAHDLIEQYPQQPEAYAQLALLHTESGASELAIATWRQALKQDHTFGAAHLGIGVLLASRAQYSEAAEHLNRAIELDPEAPHAYRELISVYLKDNKAREAGPIADEFVRRFPGLANSHYWRGQVLLQLKRWQEAQSSHEKAIGITDDWSQPYQSLAQALARLGDRDLALQYRKKFAELKLAETRADRNSTRAYDDKAAQRRVTAKIYKAAGDIVLQQRDTRRAEAYWLRAAELSPEDARSRRALEGLYASQQRLGARAQILGQLAGLEPDAPQHALNQCRCLAAMGRWEEAQALLHKLLELHPELDGAHILLAQSYLHSGNEAELAELHAQRAVHLAHDGQAYLVLAAALQQKGDQHAARETLSKGIARVPHDRRLKQAYQQAYHME